VHEYSLVEAILGRIEEEVARQGATAVRRVELRVGELAGVEPDLLADAWEIVRAGSCCAGAALVVHPSPARWRCGDCRAPIDRSAPLQCPCGGAAELEAGGELLLERVELKLPRAMA